MISSKQEDLLRVFKLECHKQADSLERIAATVNVVTHEDIVEAVNVALVRGGLPDVEEAHQVGIVAMKTAEDLYGRLDISYNYWLHCKNVNTFVSKFDDVLTFNWELRS